MKRTQGLGVLLLALFLGLPWGAGSQEVITVQSNRGWIGITFNYTAALVDGQERTVVVIEGVAEGSPAEAAGLQAGDTLTHLDGQPISQRVFASLGTLEVGDLVRLTVRRNGRPSEVLVEAGPRQPTGWVITPNRGEMVIHLDSIRGAIMENLDSLRLNITSVGTDSSGQVSISILEPPRPGEGAREPRSNYVFQFPMPDTSKVGGQFFFQEVMPLPFRAFVMETEETDSLKLELLRIRRALTEVRRAELTRLRELQGGVQQPVEALVREDEEIRDLRNQEEALIQEQVQLTRTLQEVSEAAMRRQWVEMQEQQAESWSRAFESRARTEERAQAEREEARREGERRVWEEYESRRPLTHFMVGQSFVAGAQLQPLNPSLAEYFQVEKGVLVTEVLEGTPADQAGMHGGDVIVRVGSEDVSSLEDLRFAVGYLDRPLRIRVIRKGEPVEIVIRK